MRKYIKTYKDREGTARTGVESADGIVHFIEHGDAGEPYVTIGRERYPVKSGLRWNWREYRKIPVLYIDEKRESSYKGDLKNLFPKLNVEDEHEKGKI